MTERVLDRLGGPRWFWTLVWSAVPILITLVLLTVLAAEGESNRVVSVKDVTIPQLVLVYVLFLGLWGTGRMTSQARALAPQLLKMTETSVQPDQSRRFDIAGPLTLSIAVALITFIGFVGRFGAVAAVALVAPVVVMMLPIMTFVWTFIGVLIALDRLGQHRLALDPFPQDPTLGLAPVGSLAFTGFTLLLAGVLPVPVSNADDLATVVLSLVFLGVSVVVFFLSMWRIHRQMAVAKAGYVAETQAAYAEAYEPYRRNRSLATLAAQAPLLNVAQALDERAHRIREWPIDERLVRILGFAVAAVASTIIGRLVLSLVAG